MNFYHLLILDASGSMDCIRRQAISGCNETLQSIRELSAKGSNEHFVSLVSFNSGNRTNTIYDAIPAAEATDIPETSYVPDGCTPLYDCMGLSICHLQDQINCRKMPDGTVAMCDPTPDAMPQVLVTVITDGLENASTIFNAYKLKALVEECKQQGWTFAYIGANQDEVMEAGKIGIHNTLEFCQDEEGTRKMFRNYKESTIRFCMTSAPKSAEMRETGFFKQEKKKRK